MKALLVSLAPCVFLSLPLVSPAFAAVASDRPNIVLMIADDVSVSDFGCYGHPTLKTPRIDELAEKGILFTNAYLTTSSCSPTRTSLITGRYPHNTGAPELHMGDSPILETLPQFPHLLRENGYYTVQSGKTHFNGNVEKSFEKLYGNEGAGHSGADRWVECVRERPRERPFFAWFAAYDAHRGWDTALDEGQYGLEDAVLEPYYIDDPKSKADLALYYNEVSRFDQRVGSVIDELERQGALDNTLVVVMADNGRPFPRDKTWLYDSGIKTPLVLHWPKSIRQSREIDALVSTIDLPPTFLELAGIDVPDPMQGLSVAPLLSPSGPATIRDFVFAERNWHTLRYHERLIRHGNFVYIRNNYPQWMGFNIVHWSKDGQWTYHELADAWRAGSLDKAERRAIAMLHGEAGWDLFRQPRPAEMLFDVENDPKQLTNLIGQSEHAERLDLLRQALAQWTNETGDTIPAADQMTKDRMNRATWETIEPSGRPNPGEVPGQAAKAHLINAKGPVRKSDLR